MNRSNLSRTQRLITRLAGAEGAAAMEAHSRAWLVECAHCGHQRSIWDLGGIRYKAAGRARMLMRCPLCRQTSWHKVYKSPDFPTAPAPVWPAVRVILWVAVVMLILAAVILGIVLKLSGTV